MRLTEEEYAALLKRGHVQEVRGQRISPGPHEPSMKRGDVAHEAMLCRHRGEA